MATLGFGTPWAVAQVATRVSALSARVGKYLTKLIKAIKELLPRLDDATRLFRSLRNALDNALEAGGNTLRTTTRHTDDVTDALPAPHVPAHPPRPIADGDIVDMTPFHSRTAPPIVREGPTNLDSISFDTESGRAVFWSGYSDAPGVTQRVGAGGPSSEFAASSHRTILEQVLADQGAAMPKFDRNDPSSIAAWNGVSERFAEGASGDVVAVLGSNVNPLGVWASTELPALIANSKVSSITVVDVLTGVARRIWP